jgi:hypothetical protein
MKSTVSKLPQSSVMLADPVFMLWVATCVVAPLVLLSGMGHGLIFYFIPLAILSGP